MSGRTDDDALAGGLRWSELPALLEASRELAKRLLVRWPSQPALRLPEAVRRVLGARSGAEIEWVERRSLFRELFEQLRRALGARAEQLRAHGQGGARPLPVKELERYAAWQRWAEDGDSALALDTGLARLAQRAPEPAEVISYHFFAGLTRSETARMLDWPLLRIEQNWRRARLLIEDALQVTWRRQVEPEARELELGDEELELALQLTDEGSAALRAAVALQLELGELAEEPARHRTGECVGEHIELGCHLAGEGLASVYLAAYVTGGEVRPVAVRFLPRQDGARGGVPLGTLALRPLIAPPELVGEGHVPCLLELGEYVAEGGERWLYLCTEFRDGAGPLAWCDEHALDTDARLRLFLQACAALAQLHRHGLVYGELRAENLAVELLGGEERVWLRDPGFALADAAAEASRAAAPLALSGWRAPEQLANAYGLFSAPTDIYALGMLLYELLEGRSWLDRADACDAAALGELIRSQPRPRSMQVVPPERRDRLNVVLERASALEPAERYAQVAELCDAVAEILKDEAIAVAAFQQGAELPLLGSLAPYRGLRAFEESHAEWFFGRGPETAQLLVRLREQPLLILVGVAGAGKSSLVSAGLVPAVRDGELDGSELWTVLWLRPGPAPLRELALRLHAALGLPGELAAVEARLRDPAQAAALLPGADPERRFLLVVDQFEEAFAQCRDAEQRRAFCAALAALLGSPCRTLRALLVLRADYADHALSSPEFAPLAGAAQLRLELPSEDALRAAIQRPAARAGLFLEPQLEVELLRAALGGEGGLPLLGFLLDALWRRREGRYLTHAALLELGGARGAVARWADSELAVLSERQQRAARQLLLELVDANPAGHTRRRLAVSDVIGRGREPAESLDFLSHARLVTLQEDAVELSSDALLRQWPALRAWLEEDYEGLSVSRELERAAASWAVPPGTAALWSGWRLEQALEIWAGQHVALSATATAFLEASRAHSRGLAQLQPATRHAPVRRHALLRPWRLLRWALGLALCVLAGGSLWRARALQAEASSAVHTALHVADRALASTDERLAGVAGAGPARAAILAELLPLVEPLQTHAGAEERARLDRYRAALHLQLGETQLASHALAGARAELRAALALAEPLLRGQPADPQLQELMALVHERLGDAAYAEADLEGARSAYATSAELAAPAARAAAGAQPRSLWLRWSKLGDVTRELGDFDAARRAFAAAAELARGGLQASPADAAHQRDLVISALKLGDASQAAGELAASRTSFEEAAQIAAQISQREPASAAAQQDLLVAYQRLGDVALAQGDLAAARSAFERSLDSGARLRETAADPSNTQRGLFAGHYRLGEVLRQQGNLSDAREALRSSAKAAQALRELVPGDPSADRNLSLAYRKLGEIAELQGRLGPARSVYEDDLAIVSRLAERAPEDVNAQREHFAALALLARVALRQDARSDAALYLKRAERVVDAESRLATGDPRSDADLARLRELQSALSGGSSRK